MIFLEVEQVISIFDYRREINTMKKNVEAFVEFFLTKNEFKSNFHLEAGGYLSQPSSKVISKSLEAK